MGIVGQRYIFRSKEKPFHPQLGMEATDIEKFELDMAHNLQPRDTSLFGGRDPQLELGIAQTRAIAAKLNPAQRARTTSAKVSAERLVKGVAFHNKVCLFMAGPIDQASENEQILLDIFGALNLQPKLVDVSSDNDMHLGLPQSEGLVILPYLYVGGIAFGNFGTILETVQDGSLFTAFSDADIVIDTNAAQTLQKT